MWSANPTAERRESKARTRTVCAGIGQYPRNYLRAGEDRGLFAMESSALWQKNRLRRTSRDGCRQGGRAAGLADNRGMRNLLPKQAWELIRQAATAGSGAPLFVDVRMEIESLYVGRPPGVHTIAWYEYPELAPDPPRFVEAVLREAGSAERTIVLICRSGKRTVDAALALEAAGFSDVVNVLHGFEGDLDHGFHRSTVNGWRFDGLPWEQM